MFISQLNFTFNPNRHESNLCQWYRCTVMDWRPVKVLKPSDVDAKQKFKG